MALYSLIETSFSLSFSLTSSRVASFFCITRITCTSRVSECRFGGQQNTRIIFSVTHMGCLLTTRIVGNLMAQEETERATSWCHRSHIVALNGLDGVRWIKVVSLCRCRKDRHQRQQRWNYNNPKYKQSNVHKRKTKNAIAPQSDRRNVNITMRMRFC